MLTTLRQNLRYACGAGMTKQGPTSRPVLRTSMGRTMGCLRVFGWCLLGSLLGAIGLAALGWGIGTIDVLYGHRPPGEMQTMPEFGRAMMESLASPPGLIVALCGGVSSSFARGRELGHRETYPVRSGR